MKRNTIKYIGFYDFPDSKSDRVAFISATNKMDYVCKAIASLGYNVEIISPSWMRKNTKVNYEKQKSIHVTENICVTFCPSWKSTNKISLFFKIQFSYFWLFLYLIFQVKKNEKIIVYHSPWLSTSIRIAKYIKGFNIILEVEEIYSDIPSFDSKLISLENKLLFSPEAYIFSTELLACRINSAKPYLILYGNYTNYESISKPFNDGKIHLLYTGIIDLHKRGAFNAIEACRYLSNKYTLHIIGFGETVKLCNKIEELRLSTECEIVYDGLKSGKEYISYCQKTHIGLSTQSMQGEYVQSSFPSKIMSYLSFGLRVISCYIDCVSKSKIKDYVTFYKEDNPKAIADAIMSVDLNQNYDSKSKIKELDERFKFEIKKLLEA